MNSGRKGFWEVQRSNKKEQFVNSSMGGREEWCGMELVI